MSIKYVHTNIISKDWRSLADFYINVFHCKPVPPERNLEGEWLEKGTGVKNAALKGVHLLLPGHGEQGPTLEIFQYQENEEKPTPTVANREGFAHIAFAVDDVGAVLEEMVRSGGRKIGGIVHREVGNRKLIFTYGADPEGNLVELQTWK